MGVANAIKGKKKRFVWIGSHFIDNLEGKLITFYVDI
jgi:hypothetical protein